MKNRKIIVIAFVLAAVMLMGVGYAVLTDTLKFGGVLGADHTVAQNTFDGDIYFSSGSIVNDTAGHKAIISYEDDRDTAIITATNFTAKEQQVVVLLTIDNIHQEFDAYVTPSADVISVNPTGEAAQEEGHGVVFSATWHWTDSTGTTNDGTDARLINKIDGKAYILVTITLNETPTAAHQAEFEITLTATAKKDGHEIE